MRLLLILAGIVLANFIFAAKSSDVIINEIAWMGSEISHTDEWIELHNNTDSSINLEGWILKAADGTPEIKLTRSLLANGFYLSKRSEDYTGALHNKGEKLELYDNHGNLIDSADCGSGWPGGDNSTKQTMERKAAGGWQTSKEAGGTPGAENSKPVEIKLQPMETQLETSTTSLPYQTSQSNNFWVVFVAVLIAIFSGVIILILKNKIKKEYNEKT